MYPTELYQEKYTFPEVTFYYGTNLGTCKKTCFNRTGDTTKYVFQKEDIRELDPENNQWYSTCKKCGVRCRDNFYGSVLYDYEKWIESHK